MTGAAFIALSAICLALWLFLRRRSAVLPGDLAYRDAAGTQTLVSRRHRLAGRPDYVVHGQCGLLPVELKSRACGRGPHDGERAQLLAYCLLVEDTLGGPVQGGELHYSDRAVSVPFGKIERQEINAILARLRKGEDRRSHNQAGRCRACGFRSSCGDTLA